MYNIYFCTTTRDSHFHHFHHFCKYFIQSLILFDGPECEELFNPVTPRYWGFPSPLEPPAALAPSRSPFPLLLDPAIRDLDWPESEELSNPTAWGGGSSRTTNSSGTCCCCCHLGPVTNRGCRRTSLSASTGVWQDRFVTVLAVSTIPPACPALTVQLTCLWAMPSPLHPFTWHHHDLEWSWIDRGSSACCRITLTGCDWPAAVPLARHTATWRRLDSKPSNSRFKIRHHPRRPEDVTSWTRDCNRMRRNGHCWTGSNSCGYRTERWTLSDWVKL